MKDMVINMNLSDFTINMDTTILDALKKVDKNRKGFLIVIDSNNKVLGTLTDGDIRRLLINKYSLSDSIKIKKDYNSISIDDDFNRICILFKSKEINFLPIVDKNNKLKSIITKKQFHSLLLHDNDWNLKQNFIDIDDSEIDFEVYNRPWGFYKSTLLSDFVQSKVITVFPKQQLSLQEHKKREEHWIIIKGEGQIVLGESIFDVYPGKYIYIPKGCKHQIINASSENLIFSEVQLGSYFGEDDIIRYDDKYGRI